MMPDPPVQISSGHPVIYSKVSLQSEQLRLLTADIKLMWLEQPEACYKLPLQ